MKRVAAIIPAGGSGKRYGSEIPKQYLELNGTPVIIHTMMNFQRCEDVSSIIVAVAKEQIALMKNLINEFRISKVINIVVGGAERLFSINNALKAKAIDECDIVLVHDAVRPFAGRKLITDIIKNAEEFGAAVPGLMPSETIKSTDDDDYVKKTIDRSELRAIQTPQGFKLSIIKEAYQNAIKNDIFGTDDASLVEHIGRKVKIIPGNQQNIKITTPFDMTIAKEILKNFTL